MLGGSAAYDENNHENEILILLEEFKSPTRLALTVV